MFEDGFDADFGKPTTPADIRKEAHIANGGEAQFKCPACKGRGRFISYAGRDVGPCFECKGTKFITKGQNAAIRGQGATKERNKLDWAQANTDVIAYATKRRDKGSNLLRWPADQPRRLRSLDRESGRPDQPGPGQGCRVLRQERGRLGRWVPTEGTRAPCSTGLRSSWSRSRSSHDRGDDQPGTDDPEEPRRAVRPRHRHRRLSGHDQGWRVDRQVGHQGRDRGAAAGSCRSHSPRRSPTPAEFKACCCVRQDPARPGQRCWRLSARSADLAGDWII